MADAPRPEPDATGEEPRGVRTTGRPPWQKVVGIIGLLVVLVLAVVLVLGGDHGPGRHGAVSPVAEDATEIAVTADDFAFDPDEITVNLGEDVAIALTSIDVLHDFTVDEFDAHIVAGPGESVTGGFRADRPGRFTFFCAEPGHRQAGMEGTLTVEDDESASDDR